MTAMSAIGTAGRMRTKANITAATSNVTVTAAHCGFDSHVRTASSATKNTRSPSAETPSAAGTCCSAMMTAMPMVNPSMTGRGMNFT